MEFDMRIDASYGDSTGRALSGRRRLERNFIIAPVCHEENELTGLTVEGQIGFQGLFSQFWTLK